MSTGEHYFWWNDAQRQLSNEVAEYAASNIVPRIRECEDTKRFPWRILEEIGKKGWYGVLIPREYGGMGDDYGITGMCIILEEVARGAAIAVDFYETTIYGYTPIVRFGSEEQKQKWLPPLATGEHFACIAISEPFMGSDAAAGANEVLQHQIWKQWLKGYREDRQASLTPAQTTIVSGEDAESAILKALGDFYIKHPALYMEKEELSESAGITMADIDAYLLSLEKQELVALFRTRDRVRLIKASYEGLRKANPPEYYRKFPDFVDMEKEIF